MRHGMAAQGEREPGGLMCSNSVLDPMAQEEEIEQEMLGVEEEQFFPPQTDPEPEMAAVYDTSPSLLRNPPPIPAGTAHPRAPGVAQLFAMLAEMNNKLDVQRELLRATVKVTQSVWSE